jgi:tetratricopeptide (TPR) repeat protein
LSGFSFGITLNSKSVTEVNLLIGIWFSNNRRDRGNIMDILDSIFTLIQNKFLDVLTILWILWFAGVALGVIVSTISGCVQRRTLTRLKRRYEDTMRRRDGGGVQIELDLERIRSTLLRRDAELREDAERMGMDIGLMGVLENFRGRIQRRLKDLPGTRHELVERLGNIYAELHEFRSLCGPDQISLARMSLMRGATGKAAALLKRAQSLSNQQVAAAVGPGAELVVARHKNLAAKAVFLLGQLAETDFDYFIATQYYQLAADLEPSNLAYLNAAAELSYAFEEFQETGHLLEQVLTIQEKLLGPEHPDLGQTLNNLGVLRHTQGRHAEAEAFYQWGLEICETFRDPLSQDAVNLVQNYAAFLQEIGRNLEADAVKARAAMA